MIAEDINERADFFISVILPVYNGGDYLVSSVQSVLGQSLKNFELLILDDCSTDDSWNYISNIKDPRVSIFKNKSNEGLFFSLNFLVTKSKSCLIKLWAQDDIMYTNCLKSFVEFHQKHPRIGFSYSGRDMIDEKGAIKKSGNIDNTPEIVSTDLHARIAFYTGSIAGNIANVCINREALHKVGLFNEQMKISADFDMWVRLAKDHDTGFLRDKLVQLRDHAGQLSQNESYYINHVKEDLLVYRNLLSYVNTQIGNEGKLLLRNHKLVFYYTLMVKALMKGRTTTAHKFYKELSKTDNIFILSISFIRAKAFKPSRPAFLNFNK
ncbi:MAG: glycosyltransferase [Bacteroidota bacterium]|nr:glycosyltransferase [Bacteroidota bacterium]